MAASQLNISPAYVAAVRAARPIAYWRFDRVEEGVIANEMSNRFGLRIHGPVRWRTYPAGNRSVEFGFSNESGYLLSDDVIGTAVQDGFSVELWGKPSYLQTGSMFSLARLAHGDEPPDQGVLVELIGQADDPGRAVRSRVRFLHRDPPGRNVRTGVTCYSDVPYWPRKWQHLVAVKDQDSMKLYLDGKQVAGAEDSTSTPADLQFLMGQLYPFTSGPNSGIRPFVGELAEVAVYDRPLRAAEISQHIKLVRDNKAREEAVAQRTF
jgi:hypothetical protein